MRNMEKKDFNIHDVGKVNLFSGDEEMNSSASIVKQGRYSEEMSSEVSSEVNKSSPENNSDTKFINSNETIPYPLQDNSQVSSNDGETPFCFVGIKTEIPDDYECETSSANSESQYTSGMYFSNHEEQSSDDDQYLEEKFPSELSVLSCLKIKLECEEDDDSCKSNDMSVPIDMNKKSDCSSVEHGCDMGHSSTEFIRGMNCQEYPMLRKMEGDSKNVDMQIAPSHRISTAHGSASTDEDHCGEGKELMQRTGSNVSRHESSDIEKHSNNQHLAPSDSICNKMKGGERLSTKKQIHSTKEGNYSCISCGKSFNKKSYLEKHMRTHSGEKPYHCESCVRSFKYKRNLIVHMRTHTTQRPFQCEICKESFSYQCTLKRHIMRTHLGNKPFQCEICQKSFVDRSSLKAHTPTHTREKAFQCEICKKSFFKNSYLIGHMRSHSGEKRFQCEICEKSYFDGSSLKVHIRTHTGEKPYQCEICMKSFRRKRNLNLHMGTHTRERPFVCEICQKSFIRKDHLRSHQRLHTGEKPYQCEICKNSFNREDTLKGHMRTHTGERPFQCEICSKVYSKKAILKKHMQNHHGD